MTPDPELLSDASAARLLARASELDQLRAAGASVADLRAAATEAGIAAPAFDTALAELQRTATPRVPDARDRARRRTRLVSISAVFVLVAAIMLVAIARIRTTAVTDAARAPIVEDAILLRCLTPDDAAALIRPMLTLPENSVVIRPAQSRVLTLRATAAQWQQVRDRIAPYESAQSCAVPSRSIPSP